MGIGPQAVVRAGALGEVDSARRQDRVDASVPAVDSASWRRSGPGSGGPSVGRTRPGLSGRGRRRRLRTHPRPPELHQERGGLDQEAGVAEARVRGLRCRLGVVKQASVGEKTRHLCRRHVVGVGKDPQRRQARAKVADRCGGRPGRAPAHSGAIMLVSTRASSREERSTPRSARCMTACTSCSGRVSSKRPAAPSTWPGRDSRLPEGVFPPQHRELLVDAVWQAVDQGVCELGPAERQGGRGGGRDYLRPRRLLPARVPVRRRQSARSSTFDDDPASISTRRRVRRACPVGPSHR